MKSRRIEKDEINEITKKCKPREQAFFTVIRQSGLKPNTISQLKIKDVEKILDPNTPIPCKIEIPQKNRHRKIPAFIGEEAVKYLKNYFLRDRTNPTDKDFLFTIHTNPNEKINTKDESRAFKTATIELEKSKKPTHEVRKGKSNELQLRSLIKFYEENAKPYLKEIKNSLFNEDEYRKLYKEKAMRFLEIEPPTMEALYSRDRQLEAMNKRFEKIEETIKTTLNPSPESKANLMKQPKILCTDDKGTYIRVDLNNELSKRIQESANKQNITPDELIKKQFNLETLNLKEKLKEDTEKQT